MPVALIRILQPAPMRRPLLASIDTHLGMVAGSSAEQLATCLFGPARVVLFDEARFDSRNSFWSPTERADQCQEHVESPGTERCAPAVHQQPALVRLQFKRAKTVGGGHGKKLAATFE
jgi:hypothetical protein